MNQGNNEKHSKVLSPRARKLGRNVALLAVGAAAGLGAGVLGNTGYGTPSRAKTTTTMTVEAPKFVVPTGTPGTETYSEGATPSPTGSSDQGSASGQAPNHQPEGSQTQPAEPVPLYPETGNTPESGAPQG